MSTPELGNGTNGEGALRTIWTVWGQGVKGV